MTSKLSIPDLKDQLLIINDWIKQADAKILAICVLYTWVLWFLLSNIDKLKCLLWDHYYCIGTLIILLFVIGFSFCYLVLNPIIKNTNSSSVLFFGSISKQSLLAYKQKMKGLTEEQIENAIFEQIHTNSIRATQKMKFVKLSVYPLLSIILICIILFFYL